MSALTAQALLPALLALYGCHEPAFLDDLEYRREQECFAATLAAERATKADKARISDILTTMKTAWAEGNTDTSREMDYAPHMAIVDASQNVTMIHMMASVFELTRQTVFYNRDFLKTIDGSGKMLLDQHVALGQAIISCDARVAAAEHMDFVERSFRLGMEQERRESPAEKRRLLSG